MAMNNYESAVAVIGMSGRFPGAGSVDELWRNIADERVGLRAVTEAELTRAGVSPAVLASPDYVRMAAPLDGIDLFDAAMFGFSRREAESTEPQHRLFLECSWEVLEAAGYLPNRAPGKVGVFAGCGYPDYMQYIAPRLAAEAGGDLLVAVGTERDSLASMVSYKLDLRGPSLTVQTFCSTSLVAVHLAVQSLLTFESDMAIAGGAHIAIPQPTGYLFEEGGITTPDGRIRSFDAAARGTVLGNGVAVVALKRMTEALADGDVIHAVILGSAVNNDGRACAGYTAPGVDGQAEVIELALGVADVKPESVGYVECHATGTLLGDSIELAAMSRVFDPPPPRPCVLSSLKPSLGHLDRASGAVGLIRAALALSNRTLPGTPGFETPNPALAAANDRFEVLAKPRPWPAGVDPRRAGVSSFGFGGTNAHVVLEEAPTAAATPPRPGPHLLVHSARDLNALYTAVEQLAGFLGQHPGLDLADTAYTLQQSRTGFPLRWAAVCDDHADALAALADPGRWIVSETRSSNALVAMRIPDPETLPAQWARELCAAVRELLPPVAADYQASSVQREALRALVAGATGLGARLALVAEGPAAEQAVTELAAEFGTEPEAGTDELPAVSIEPDAEQTAAAWLLGTLARLWQAGAALDWAALHPGSPRRVTLPTYPFQRQRYWIEPSLPSRAQLPPAGKNPDRTRWTYIPGWRRQSVQVPELHERLREAGPWLVFAAEDCGEAVVRGLLEAGADVTAVRPGPELARTGSGDFTVRPDHAGDMRGLLQSMVLPPRSVVHGYALACDDQGEGTAADRSRFFDDAQLMGSYSVRALAGALAEINGSPDVRLVVLTDGAVGVTGPDLRHGEHASVVGLLPVLAQENPSLSCRHVDIDARLQASRGMLAGLAGHVLAETAAKHAGPTAWRAGGRWVRSYEPQELVVPGPEENALAAGSTVLITGGLGQVGLVLARRLAARGCRLVLTGRSPLPPREQWPQLLAEPGGEGAARIAAILDLEKSGAQVLAMSADVASLGEMSEVLRAARQRFGPVDAVVHGAGVQDARFFGAAHTLDRSAYAAHFRAKVHGFYVLEELLDEQTTRRLTLSSLSAVLGGIGFGAYAAANAALDAQVLAAQDGGAGRWLTVDWEAWQLATAPDGERGAGVSGFGMTAEEGADIFDRAAAAVGQVGHLVVSTGPLHARLDQWVVRPAGDGDAPETPSGARDPRPSLPTPYVQASEGTESILAGIWAEALGLDRVGADDDFYRLGGNSVTAIELTARVRKQMQVALPVTSLLENPSVRQLAAEITGLAATMA